ncbi:MAG: thermonuclease family protein [Pseudomonadota bacterium]
MTIRYWALAIAAVIAVIAVENAVATQGGDRIATVTRVIDGDTFEIAGGARVRVRNFDTPELRNYECADERYLARAARDAARRILKNRKVTLVITDQDRYRRLVADVIVHEGSKRYDFVDRMVSGGHGARWLYGYEPQPTWCGEGPSLERRVIDMISGLFN